MDDSFPVRGCYVVFAIGVFIFLMGFIPGCNNLKMSTSSKKATATIHDVYRPKGKRGVPKNHLVIKYKWTSESGEGLMGFSHVSLDWVSPMGTQVEIDYIPGDLTPTGATTSRLANGSRRNIWPYLIIGLICMGAATRPCIRHLKSF